MTPVLVVWSDAFWNRHGNIAEILRDRGACIRRSLGWLVYEDQEFVVIAQHDDRGGVHGNTVNDPTDVAMTLTIPRGMVKEMVAMTPLKKARLRSAPFRLAGGRD